MWAHSNNPHQNENVDLMSPKDRSTLRTINTNVRAEIRHESNPDRGRRLEFATIGHSSISTSVVAQLYEKVTEAAILADI